MFDNKRLSIRKEVFYLGLTFAGISLIFFGILFFASFGLTSIQTAKESMQETNIKASLITEGIFKKAYNTVEILTSVTDIAKLTSADSPGAKTALQIYKQTSETNEDVGFIYSGYPDGSLLINDYIPPKDYNATKRPWYTNALKSKPEQSIGLPYRDANTNEWLISQSKAILNQQGKVKGVLAIDVFLDRTNALLEKEKQYPSQQSIVLDHEGKAIIHPDKKMINHKITYIAERLTGEKGQFFFHTNNSKKWAFYNTIDEVNWYIVTTVDRSKVINPILLRTSVYAVCIALIGMLLALLQSRHFGKRIADPLIALGKSIEEIVENKSKTSLQYTKSNDEIAAIANNIEELTERALQKKTKELKTIIEHSSDGIIVVDNNRQVIYINSRFKQMWNLPADIDLTSENKRPVQYVLNQLEAPKNFLNRVNAFYTYPQHDWGTVMLTDGRIFEWVASPITNDDLINGILWTFRDITENKLAEEKLQRMATVDSLTGLYNRQYFETELAKALAYIRRYSTSISLIMLDLDHFKDVNDNYGHDVGDKVLVEFAKRSKTILREPDILVRWGGEEFIIILPETDINAAGEAAERLRNYIMSEQFFHVGRVTISLGVTGILLNDTKDSLLKRLDDALYESKHLGRNRVTIKYPDTESKNHTTKES
ncbi:MAG: diguanylate cyclase [Thermodesulfobacteriota bacterium]